MMEQQVRGHCHGFMHHILQKQQPVDSNVIQYANERTTMSLYSFSQRVVSTLNPTKKYLNIGTGVGFLEYIAKMENKHIETSDQYYNINDTIHTTYEWWQNKLGVSVNYRMINYTRPGEFRFDGPVGYFDEAIATRFGPFQRDTREFVPYFMAELKKLTPYLRIYKWEVDDKMLEYFHSNYETAILGNTNKAIRIKL